jgi:hypothetical protein
VDARDTSFRLVVKSLIAAALVGLLVLALLRLLDLLILVFGAVVVATLLRGFAEAIERRTPLNGSWSLAAAILIVVAAFVGFAWLFGSQLQTDLGAVARTLRQSWEGLRLGIAGFPGGKDVAAAMQNARMPTDNFVPRLVGALNWVPRWRSTSSSCCSGSCSSPSIPRFIAAGWLCCSRARSARWRTKRWSTPGWRCASGSSACSS